MLRTFLRSKIHSATVTEANIEYMGSLSIDEDLLELAQIQEYEQVHIANVTNGERLTTYAIKAPRGSRTIGANGAAAHLVREGDRIIIFSYGLFDEKDLIDYKPRLVFVNENNDPIPGPAREHHAQVM